MVAGALERPQDARSRKSSPGAGSTTGALRSCTAAMISPRRSPRAPCRWSTGRRARVGAGSAAAGCPRAAARWRWHDGSAIPFPLRSSTSGIELQHIIGIPARRRLMRRIADYGAGGCRQTIVAIRSHVAKPVRITGPRVRRPTSGNQLAPVGRRRYLRRARLRAPRGDGRLCAAFRYAQHRKRWSRGRHST